MSLLPRRRVGICLRLVEAELAAVRNSCSLLLHHCVQNPWNDAEFSLKVMAVFEKLRVVWGVLHGSAFLRETSWLG
jgi:hypothetical protein